MINIVEYKADYSAFFGVIKNALVLIRHFCRRQIGTSTNEQNQPIFIYIDIRLPGNENEFYISLENKERYHVR